MDVGEKICKTFIVDNFETQELLTLMEDVEIDKDICLDVWKSSVEKNSRSNLKFDDIQGIRFVKNRRTIV